MADAIPGLQSIINYMIPAVGTPRGYVVSQNFIAGTPVAIDFRGVTGGGIDGQPFRPSGIYADNSAGTAPLTIVINEMAYQITIPAGESLNLPFPAPVDVSVRIAGEGQATVIFTDVPVMPYRSW